MKPVLLADFGATRIKVAAWDLAGQKELTRLEVPSPSLRPHQGRHEIDGELYHGCWNDTVGKLVRELNIETIDVWLCTEMHGFILVDGENRPVTGYISWQDQRSSEPEIDGSTVFGSLTDEERANFYERSGMRVRPGLPYVNLKHWDRHEGRNHSTLKFMSLADWLVFAAGDPSPLSHPTMAAASGFFNRWTWSWDDKLVVSASANDKIIFPPVAATGRIGTVQVGKTRVHIKGGVGDLQAALWGAGFFREFDSVINLGTGSQVVSKYAPGNKLNGEFRPSISGRSGFSAITHIPSGRALNAFADLFDSAAQFGGGQPIFWSLWGSLTVEEVVSAPPLADLKIFEAAGGYSQNSGFLRMREGCTNVRKVIAGIAKSWLDQYRIAFADMGVAKVKRIGLAGGLARRGKFVRGALETLLEVPCAEPEAGGLDETLLGLLYLAQEDGRSE